MYIIMNSILKKFRQFLLQISSQLKSKVEEYAMTSEIEFIFYGTNFPFFPIFQLPSTLKQYFCYVASKLSFLEILKFDY